MHFTKLHCILVILITNLNLINSIDEIVYDALDLLPGPLSTVFKISLKSLDRTVIQKPEETIPEKIDNMMEGIHKKLSTIETNIENQALTIISNATNTQAGNNLKELSAILHTLDRWYKRQFSACVVKKDACTEDTRQKFIQLYTEEGSNEVLGLLGQIPILIEGIAITNISDYLPSSYSEGLFDLMISAHNLQVELGTHCGLKRSLNQQIYDIYNVILQIMTKNYLAVYTAMYEMHRDSLFSGNKTNIEELKLWNGDWAVRVGTFYDQVLIINEVVLKALRKASKEVFPCDPNIWGENNYSQLKYFINGYMAAERVLNEDGSCSHHCSDYSNVTYIPMEKYANELACRGRIYDCTFTDANTVTVPVDFGFDKGVGPRYHFVGKTYCYGTDHLILKRYGKGYYNVTQGRCNFGYTNFYSTTLNVDDWHPFYKCDMCHCICDNVDHAHTVRRFTHEMVTSIVSAGYVITGLIFHTLRNSYGIAIQQGRIINGTIQSGTVGWIYPDFNPTENLNDTLTYESRCMNLDNIEAPLGYVITGVAFTKVGNCQSLKLQATKLDIYGNLIPSETIDLTAPNNGNRTEIKLSAPDESNLAPRKNKVISKPSQNYINFQVTDWVKDASQHVVPYLDTQFVSVNVPTPLGGVGLYYKGVEEYGGFIGLSILTPNFESALDQNLIADTFREFLNKTLLKTDQ